MKKLFLILTLVTLVSSPILMAQAGGTPSSDYTLVLMKKTTPEKITAFEAYIKKYPATTNKYTKFAYYWLAVYNFQQKKLSTAIKYGTKSNQVGGLDDGMKANLYFVLGRSYASKGSLFNKDKALSFTNKAIQISKAINNKKILASAQKIKKSLSTPPKPSETPAQKIKRLYSDEDFDGVISTYKGMKDKSDKTLHLIYTNALYKNMNYKEAIPEISKLYSADKKGKHALKIADCNAALAKRIRSKKAYYLKEAIKYYVEAGVLYGREGKKSNNKNAILKAKNMIYDKYNLSKKIAAYNKKLKSQKSSASKNQEAIKKADRELKRFKRYLRREYRDMEMPPYEIKKRKALEKKLRDLQSGNTGGSSKADDSGKKLQAEMKKANAELETQIQMAKTRLK